MFFSNGKKEIAEERIKLVEEALSKLSIRLNEESSKIQILETQLKNLRGIVNRKLYKEEESGGKEEEDSGMFPKNLNSPMSLKPF